MSVIQLFLIEDMVSVPLKEWQWILLVLKWILIIYLFCNPHYKSTKYVFSYQLGPFVASDTKYNSNSCKQKERICWLNWWKAQSLWVQAWLYPGVQTSSLASCLSSFFGLAFFFCWLLSGRCSLHCDLQKFHSYIIIAPSLGGKRTPLPRS